MRALELDKLNFGQSGLLKGRTLRKLASIIAILLFATLAIGTAGNTSASSRNSDVATPVTASTSGAIPTASQHQGITGSVSIGPVSPICSTTAPPVPTTGPDLVVTFADGKILVVPLSWTLFSLCEDFAPFQVGLNPGIYTVNLTRCIYVVSCQQQLPRTVDVDPGIYKPVIINIVTGVV